jgi:hypothetical protein
MLETSNRPHESNSTSTGRKPSSHCAAGVDVVCANKSTTGYTVRHYCHHPIKNTDFHTMGTYKTLYPYFAIPRTMKVRQRQNPSMATGNAITLASDGDESPDQSTGVKVIPRVPNALASPRPEVAVGLRSTDKCRPDITPSAKRDGYAHISLPTRRTEGVRWYIGGCIIVGRCGPTVGAAVMRSDGSVVTRESIELFGGIIFRSRIFHQASLHVR